MNRVPAPARALGLLVLASLCGCVNLDPKPDPTRYYVLDAAATAAAASPADCTLTLLVGPIRLAGHIDQNPLVERRGAYEIVPLPLHLWAEPLSQSLPRIIVRELGEALPTACVLPYQRLTPSAGALQMELEVTRLELTAAGEAAVAVQGRVFKPGEAGPGRAFNLSKTRAFEAGDDRVANAVKALAETLDEVLRSMAAEVAPK